VPGVTPTFPRPALSLIDRYPGKTGTTTPASLSNPINRSQLAPDVDSGKRK
jgi:hypothetical protein